MPITGRERDILQCNMALFATREQLMYAMDESPSRLRDRRVAELRARQHILRATADRLQMYR